MPKRVPQEWLILATAFTSLVVAYGIWYSFSVFLVAFVREFGWSRALVSAAFSFFVLVHGIAGPAVGWVLRRSGARRPILCGGLLLGVGLLLTAQTTAWWHLYIAFGVITAIGMSLAGWIPAVVLVQGWFPSRFGTAMGLASAGIGVGILGMLPLAQLLIDSWGWRWAYRVEAGFALAWFIPAAVWLVRDPPTAASSRADGPTVTTRGWTLAEALRTRRFWALAGAYFAANFVTQMLLIHQVAYLVDHGVTAMTAAAVGGVVGLVSTPAKAGWGALSDRVGRELTATLAFLCVLASLAALALAGRTHGAVALYGYAVLIGLGYAVMSAVFPAICSDLFSGPGFPTIYGTLYTIICLGLAAGAWSAGKMFDLTGSYASALWIGAAMAAITPVLFWIAAPRTPNPPPDRGPVSDVRGPRSRIGL